MDKKQLDILDEGTIEGVSKVLGECGSGPDISRILGNCNILDDSGESTKWRRLYHIFLRLQNEAHSPNEILTFIRAFLIPSRFVGRNELFEKRRMELNNILVFAGVEYGKDGTFRFVDAARTLDEADRRVNAIRERFKGRRMHEEVNRYCRAELLQENYFHAVFEAAKGLAQRIRIMSGVEKDGAELIDKVFSSKDPILAINTLQTETEQSEHKGFAQLLKGCFSAVRNPLAHEPKILWNGEDDAADYLSLISLLHRKLDSAVKIR